MAKSGILAQVAGAAATEVLVYTSPPNETTSITTLFIVNRGAASNFRLRATFSGDGTASNRQYLYYDTAIDVNETLAVSAGITLGPGESLFGQGTSANINFVVFGRSA